MKKRKSSVILGTVLTVRILERCWLRKCETTVDFSLHVKGGALEAAIRIFFEDRLVMAVWVLAALQHGRHDVLQLLVEVAAVVCVGGCL